MKKLLPKVLILMELATCDLSSFLKEGHYRLDATTIGQIFSSLCGSLEAVHSKNIIHFDLKPHNVLLCSVPRSKRGRRAASENAGGLLRDDEQGPMKLIDGVWALKLGDFGLAHVLEVGAVFAFGRGPSFLPVLFNNVFVRRSCEQFHVDDPIHPRDH